MIARVLFFVLGISCWVCGAALENSIVPIVEKFEMVENLSASKYAPGQYAQIVESLKRKADRIRVVSYNVLFNINDESLDPINRWKERLPRIVELLTEMQPDVIGVQELFRSQFDDLLPLIAKTYGVYYDVKGQGELNAIFYRKGRFEQVKGEVVRLSKPDKLDICSTLTCLELLDKKSNQKVIFFNTHLPFEGIAKREENAIKIAEIISSYPDQQPIVLMGDFNTFPNRPDLSALPAFDGDYIKQILTTHAPLKDAMGRALVGHVGPIATFTNVPEGKTPFKGLGTPGVILDHIYISKGIVPLLHAIQPATVGGHFPSDHMPVFIDCVLKIE
ncbi:MAG: endonuclease/exonuclease/phosphatase family protein [Chlamydiota bacterium]